MDHFIARQPILDVQGQVFCFSLQFGPQTRAGLLSEPGDISAFDLLVGSLKDGPAPFIDYAAELGPVLSGSLPMPNSRGATLTFGKCALPGKSRCAALKYLGFKLAFDCSHFVASAPEVQLADVMLVDVLSVNLSAQAVLIKNHKNRVRLLADKVQSWSDFKVARDMGYDLFRGPFFLSLYDTPRHKDIRSLDVCLLGTLAELEKPEPDFKNISDIIEHDLGLSYKLLRLVNSAYMAPKYKIRSISQALTYLGTRELYQWISMLMFNGIKSEENSELVVISLIRGKLMAMLAQELHLGSLGSDPFFAGLFSLIDVLLNRSMGPLLQELPLSEDIQEALCGGTNALSQLLDFVIGYEQGDWRTITGRTPLDVLAPERMTALYIDAHHWAKLMDQPI